MEAVNEAKINLEAKKQEGDGIEQAKEELAEAMEKALEAAKEVEEALRLRGNQ